MDRDGASKGLFDNAAESPGELAFRKGDILMVLEQEQDGGPGWWLCSLQGRQGIAPANRLRLLQTAPDAPRAPSVDSVYLSPVQQGHVNRHRLEDGDGVYLSPPSPAEGVYQSPAGASGSGSRPRSHSSSGARPRPEWADIGVEGRPRSPSLRGRTGEAGSVYQTPATTAPLGAPYRSQGASDSVYLSPSAVPRSTVETGSEAAYLSPRDSSITGHSDACYLVPWPTVAALPGEDFYQTPVNMASVPVLQDGVTSQVKTGQEHPGMYQTPSAPGTAITRTPQAERKLSAGSVVVSVALGQNVNTPPTSRSSARAQGQCATPPFYVKGSPLLVRTAKCGLPGSPYFGRKPPLPAPPVRSVTRKDLPQGQATSPAAKPTMQAGPPTETAKEEKQRQISKDGGKKKDIKMMKTECTLSDDGTHVDQLYDTPPTNRWQQPVPTLSAKESESIYNTPRAVPLHNEQGSESALSSASVAATPSRDLAASLAEILSVWKAGHSGDRLTGLLFSRHGPVLHLLPALSVCGASPLADSLLTMVCRALEDSSTILQSQTRPRLPSQESLSRRPLPALPVAEVKPMSGGMGSRKGSWIQERPLPPPPVPAFPLPPAPPSLPLAGEMSEDERGNEYAGIGLTPAPPVYPAGDSVGYVKLQRKPEPTSDSQAETGTSQVISTNVTRFR
ncbi:uncharacterized protein Hap1MRO34_012702 [Clarias gariepinus]